MLLAMQATALHDGAWIGWLLITLGALASAAIFGFILKPKSEREHPEGHPIRKPGGLFYIDAGIPFPPGRTPGALYGTPKRFRRYTRKGDPGPPPWPVKVYGRTYVYPVGSYLPKSFPGAPQEPIHFSFNCMGGVRKDPSSIERGVRPTLPVTPKKQKGLSAFKENPVVRAAVQAQPSKQRSGVSRVYSSKGEPVGVRFAFPPRKPHHRWIMPVTQQKDTNVARGDLTPEEEEAWLSSPERQTLVRKVSEAWMRVKKECHLPEEDQHA